MLVSIGSNGLRSALSFLSGLLIARGLTPYGYGDLMFLLGSFVAFRSLLDMGSSSAFFTFISRELGNKRHILFYFGWLGVQFAVTVLVVAVVMPQSIMEKIWLGHGRYVILFAFVSSFLQQQLWPAIGQVGESVRRTLRVQYINLVVAVSHLIVIALLLATGRMTVTAVFLVLVIEYLLASLVGIWLLPDKDCGHCAGTDPKIFTFKGTLLEYWNYCRPLFILGVIAFAYEFADRWMLQRFGGGNQQGYYQIAFQFAAVSLIATTSILNVFWKEIAEAHSRLDLQRVELLYRKVSRVLVMFGAALSGFLIAWTGEIVRIFLGASYALAAPVLALMFLYPIHQSMGQIGGTMLLASGRTKAYMTISSLVMLVSLPVSYFIQAPPTAPVVAGMGLGAKGMALKMVILNIVSVNFQAWVIARCNKWRFDWAYQVGGIGVAVSLGFLAKTVVGAIWDLSNASPSSLLLPFLLAAILYVVAVIASVWLMPWLAGVDRKEIASLLVKLFPNSLIR